MRKTNPIMKLQFYSEHRAAILKMFSRTTIILALMVPHWAAASVESAFNVRSFGATGDGKTLDQAAINQAIDACAQAGGGTVLVPAGTYLCGSIHLKSNIHLLI